MTMSLQACQSTNCSISHHAVCSANQAVERVKERHQLGEDPALSCSHKQKYTMTFSVEDRAKVGNYAAENGVKMGQKHFKQHNQLPSTNSTI